MRTPTNARNAATLATEFSKYLSRNYAHKTSRTDILSPLLCKDVLHRLAPTLHAHQGCDLIDVNPGVCVWSKELHAALKPRRHILVEPEADTFAPSITPLLQQPGMKFHHVRTLNEVFDQQSGLLSAHVTEFQTQPSIRPNPSLLMTVNLSASVTTSERYSGSDASHFFNDMYTSLFGLGHEIYRYGLIRILAWVPDGARYIILPRLTDQRSKQSVQFEASSTIQEVAGPARNRAPDVTSRERRWYDLELESMAALKGAEADTDSQLSKSRVDLPPLPSFRSLTSPTIEKLHELDLDQTPDFVKEFLGLDKHMQRTDPIWYETARLGKGNQKTETPDQRKWRRFLARVKTANKGFAKVVSIVKDQRDLEQAWRRLNLSAVSGAEKTRQVEQFTKTASRLKAALDNRPRDNRILARKAIDDYRAYDSDPRALMWNRRTMEPLVVEDEEFASNRSLALLDITPDPSFLQTLDSNSKRICFDYMLSRMTGSWTKSVQQALQDVLQAGVDEFVETVPCLRDPVKGGWYDLTDLRVRTLPARSVIEMALAFERWPFRPEADRLMVDTLQDGVNWQKDG